MRIDTFAAGSLDTNAYLIIDEVSSCAIIVDAPENVARLLVPAVRDAACVVRQIIITHGHWDHIAGLGELLESFPVPVAVHPLVIDRLTRPSASLPVEVDPVEPDEELNEGDTIDVGETAFSVMHLPGHDEGHIVLYSDSEKVVLGGDVLFPAGHGRTDLPGSDQRTMDQSLARLAALPDDVTVYPGHGLPTTIGAERGWLPTEET